MEQVTSLISRIRKVQAEASARSFTLDALAKKADVSISWLSKFANGKIPNPTVSSISKVNDALAEWERQ